MKDKDLREEVNTLRREMTNILRKLGYEVSYHEFWGGSSYFKIFDGPNQLHVVLKKNLSVEKQRIDALYKHLGLKFIPSADELIHHEPKALKTASKLVK